MIIAEVTQVGHKVLRNKAVAVTDPKSKSVQKVVTDLVDSMRHHGLVGMAAPQIGKGVRVFVTKIRGSKLRRGDGKENADALRVFINPRIISVTKTEKAGWEGCGSVACSGLFGMVKRPVSVTIEAVDEKGNPFLLKAQNLLARVIQHEMDHLNGIVFADKADTSTYMSRNEYVKMRDR
jgi:peptide deformylase